MGKFIKLVDIEGNIYVVGSYRGRRGIFKCPGGGKNPTLFVSGIGLVGMAFDYDENLIIADTSSVYRIHADVMGKPLP